MVKKITKRTLIILFAILLYMTFFKISEVKAMSVEEARNAIANLAVSFQSRNGGRCVYDVGANYMENRAWTYNNMSPNDSSGQQYIFDCLGFVTYIVHYATGLKAQGDATGNSWSGGNGFVNPGIIIDTEHFEEVSISDAKAGDILWTKRYDPNPHVAIYVGGGMMVDMGNDGVMYRSMHALEPSIKFYAAARLYSLDGATDPPIDDGTEITPTPMPDPTPGASGENSGGTTIPNPNLVYRKDLVDLDNQNFEFNGMPITVRNAGGHSFMYYINKIGEAFDYLFGIILNGFKVVPVGIITGLENWITDILNSLNTVTI